MMYLFLMNCKFWEIINKIMFCCMYQKLSYQMVDDGLNIKIEEFKFEINLVNISMDRTSPMTISLLNTSSLENFLIMIL